MGSGILSGLLWRVWLLALGRVSLLASRVGLLLSGSDNRKKKDPPEGGSFHMWDMWNGWSLKMPLAPSCR